MQFIFLMMSVLCFQESTESVPTASAVVRAAKPVRVEVAMYSFRSNVEISQQQQLSIAEFLADPKVQAQKLWSNDFSSTTLAGSELALTLGENRSLVSGITVGVNGRTTPNLVRQQVGTMLKVTPKIADDGRIQAKLSIEASRIEEGDPDVELTEKMMQTGIIELQHTSTILVASGKPEVIVFKQDDTTYPEKSRKYLMVVTMTALD